MRLQQCQCCSNVIFTHQYAASFVFFDNTGTIKRIRYTCNCTTECQENLFFRHRMDLPKTTHASKNAFSFSKNVLAVKITYFALPAYWHNNYLLKPNRSNLTPTLSLSTTMSIYLVSYDIQSDKQRKKVADKLIEYGLTRVQYSVFLGPLKTHLLQNLKTHLPTHLTAKDDRLFIMPLTAKIVERSDFLGNQDVDQGYILGTKNTLYFD